MKEIFPSKNKIMAKVKKSTEQKPHDNKASEREANEKNLKLLVALAKHEEDSVNYGPTFGPSGSFER